MEEIERGGQPQVGLQTINIVLFIHTNIMWWDGWGDEWGSLQLTGYPSQPLSPPSVHAFPRLERGQDRETADQQPQLEERAAEGAHEYPNSCNIKRWMSVHPRSLHLPSLRKRLLGRMRCCCSASSALQGLTSDFSSGFSCPRSSNPQKRR